MGMRKCKNKRACKCTRAPARAGARSSARSHESQRASANAHEGADTYDSARASAYASGVRALGNVRVQVSSAYAKGYVNICISEDGPRLRV